MAFNVSLNEEISPAVRIFKIASVPIPCDTRANPPSGATTAY